MKRGAPEGQRSRNNDESDRLSKPHRGKQKRNPSHHARNSGPNPANSSSPPVLKPTAWPIAKPVAVAAPQLSAPPQPIPKLIPGYYWDSEKRRYFKGKPPAPAVLPLPLEDSPLPSACTSVASLLQSRQCCPRRSLSSLTAAPMKLLRRSSLFLGKSFVGDIQACEEQPNEKAMLVALSQDGLCVADLAWKADTETLGISTRHVLSGVTTSRWNPESTEFLAAVKLGAHNAPGSVDILKVTDTQVASVYYASERRGSLWTFEWSPDGGSYAVGRTGGGVVFDLENLKVTAFLTTKMSDVFAVAYTRSGNVVLHGDRSGVVRSHDLRSSPTAMRNGSHLPIIKLKSSTCAMHLMRDQHYLITGSLKDELVMWDRRMQRQVAHYQHHVTALARLSFSLDPTERFVTAYGSDDRLRIWDVRGGEPISVRSSSTSKAGYRPLWTEHWGAPSLFTGDGDLCMWHL